MPKDSTKLLCCLFTLITSMLWGQDKIYLDGEGNMIFRDISISSLEAGSKVEFRLSDPKSGCKYFIAYDFYERPVYTNSLMSPNQIVYFDNQNRALVTTTKKERFMQFQLYRIPVKVWKSIVKTKKNEIVKELKTNARQLLTQKRDSLVLYIESIPFDSIKYIMESLNEYNTELEVKTSLDKELADFLATRDSLTKPDLITYTQLKENRKLLKSRLEHYQQLLETTIKAKVDITQQLLVNLESSNKDYLDNLNAIATLDLKKSTFRMEKENDFKAAIKSSSDKLKRLKKEGLQKFIKLQEDIDKTYTYDLELMYNGSLIIDKDVKWVDYETTVVADNTPKFRRISGSLPVMDEFEYLGISLKNMPLSLIQADPGFSLTIETEKSTETIDRFGGVRTVLAPDEQDVRSFQVDADFVKLNKHIQLLEGKINKIDSVIEVTWDCNNLSRIRLKDILDNWNEFVASCPKTSGEIKKSVEAYKSLMERLGKAGKAEVVTNTDKTKIDFNTVAGSRFTQNTIPIIKIMGKEKDKAVPVLVSDKLEPVVKKYWFGLSTGLLVSYSNNYQYIIKTNQVTQQKELLEQRVIDAKTYPSIFMSLYFKGQRLDKRPTLKNSLSLNLGVDYVNLLDAVYLGLGFEPIRHVQVNFGPCFSKVKKLNRDNYDPYSLEYKPYLQDKWVVGGYVGVNFYLNVIPATIKSVFGKKIKTS